MSGLSRDLTRGTIGRIGEKLSLISPSSPANYICFSIFLNDYQFRFEDGDGYLVGVLVSDKGGL